MKESRRLLLYVFIIPAGVRLPKPLGRKWHRMLSCPIVPGRYSENWGLDDPTGKSDEVFKETIQLIEEKVLQLKEKLS